VLSLSVSPIFANVMHEMLSCGVITHVNSFCQIAQVNNQTNQLQSIT